MPNYTSPMASRIFIQAQPTLTAMQNTAGVWNPAGAQFVQIEENALTVTPNEAKIQLAFVHGSPSPLGSISGRKSGSWSFNVPVFPSGTQAVAPDIDLLIQGVFGGPGALQTGTAYGNAWQYGFSNFSVVPLSFFLWNHGQSNVGSRFSLGSIVQSASINFNGDILTLSLNGQAVAVSDIETFAGLDIDAKGGLSAYPVEPSTFASNGSAIHGYGGIFTFTAGGVSYTMSKMVNTFGTTINTGMRLYDTFVDTSYPAAVLYGGRSVSMNFGCLNNDDASVGRLKVAARANEKINFFYVLGTVPGKRLYIAVNNVQLVPANVQDNGDMVQLDFGSSIASAAPGQANDCYLGFI